MVQKKYGPRRVTDPYPKNVRGRPKKTASTIGNATKKKQSQEIVPISQLPTETGSVFVVGNGECGQLGFGPYGDREKITGIKFLHDKEIVDIAVGPLHNVAIDRHGKMYTWGCNDHGALGRATTAETEARPVPPDDIELEGVKIVKAACGGSITWALSNKGELYASGAFRCTDEGVIGFSRNEPEHQQTRFVLYQPTAHLKVADIAAGLDHAVLLTVEGRLYTWGSSEDWQLGRKGTPRYKHLTLQPEIVQKLKKINIVKIGCGMHHTLAADDQGKIYAWGQNIGRQCLLNTGDFITTPTLLPHFSGTPVKQLEGGLSHSVILLENGQVFTFGSKVNGKLGLGGDFESNQGSSDVNSLVPLKLPPIKNIAVGDHHTLALTNDGRVYSWGDGVSYQLGNQSDQPVYSPSYIECERFEEDFLIKKVEAGSQHSVFFGVKR